MGDWRWPMYEAALAAGMESCGWEVIPFRTQEDFTAASTVERALGHGASVSRVNERFLRAFRETQPDLVFMQRPRMLLKKTIQCARHISESAQFAQYHNDNPFVSRLEAWKWRHYMGLIPEVDMNFVFRPSNLAHAVKLGSRWTRVLMPYYVIAMHRPLAGGAPSDVLFVGHNEDDGRAGILDFLVRSGVRVRVLGTGWESDFERYPWLKAQAPHPVVGDDYARELSAAKLGLVFLSSRNRDVWTTRCFEIPACGTAMLLPRTRELQSLFAEGEEAAFFSNPGELLELIRRYLSSNDLREELASRGRERCVADRHNEEGRAAQILSAYEVQGTCRSAALW